MRNISITLDNGKWYFNGVLYSELFGIEKTFVDKMLAEVKIELFKAQRTKNEDLKRHNHKFNN
jgi:hypothetical protein